MIVHVILLAVFSPTSIQAELLTGLPVPDLASGYQAVRELQSRGPGCVVLTLGEKGVLFTELGAETKTIRHIEALKVDVIDTTVSRVDVRGSVHFPFYHYIL